MKKQSGFSAVEGLLIILLVAIVGFAGWYVWSQKNSDNAKQTAQQSSSQQSSKKEATTAANNTFGDTGDYGTFRAVGYAKTVQVSNTEADCGMSNPGVTCPTMDAIFFVITKTENQSILPYLEKIHLADTPTSSFQMGCLDKTQISYSNDSDSKGWQSYAIDSKSTSAFLNSSESKQISAEITKDKLSYGKDAPNCYSTFTTYKVIN